MSAPTQTHCGFHHGPADQCPPIDPELGDLIPDLNARGVPMRLVPALLYTVHCEDCVADDVHERIADAAAVVCHRAPSEALPDGYIYRSAICAEHLWQNVIWELRRGCEAWIEIPHEFGSAS